MPPPPHGAQLLVSVSRPIPPQTMSLLPVHAKAGVVAPTVGGGKAMVVQLPDVSAGSVQVGAFPVEPLEAVELQAAHANRTNRLYFIETRLLDYYAATLVADPLTAGHCGAAFAYLTSGRTCRSCHHWGGRATSIWRCDLIPLGVNECGGCVTRENSLRVSQHCERHPVLAFVEQIAQIFVLRFEGRELSRSAVGSGQIPTDIVALLVRKEEVAGPCITRLARRAVDVAERCHVSVVGVHGFVH